MQREEIITMLTDYFSNLENCTFKEHTEGYYKNNFIYLLKHNTTNMCQLFRVDSDGFIDFWGDFGDRESFNVPIFNDYVKDTKEYFLELFDTIKELLYKQVRTKLFSQEHDGITGITDVYENGTYELTPELIKSLTSYFDGYNQISLDQNETYYITAQNFDGSIDNKYMLSKGTLTKL